MFATINHKGKTYKTDLSQPLDISIPMRASEQSVRAWYVDPMRIEPVRMGDWVGEVKQGGSVNFRNIFFNPHGHGTHTECVGHISNEDYSINQELKTFFFIAEVVTVLPEQRDDGDFVITKTILENVLDGKRPEALVIRTLSNSPAKLTANYSNTNPPYINAEAMQFIIGSGIDHLLLDMPSVDKEVDGGKLAAHKTFWEYPENTQAHRTITEMIYVPNTVYDGPYLLNLQFAPFENDASPSKPVLYRIIV
ncbi:MAG: N-formylkynurenine (Aryl-) formamidase [Bacteroidetes bacterium]|nr:MAG: N-formylkynurenine (Aryl-) formamidase [Bacteroidota bacterium]